MDSSEIAGSTPNKGRIDQNDWSLIHRYLQEPIHACLRESGAVHSGDRHHLRIPPRHVRSRFVCQSVKRLTVIVDLALTTITCVVDHLLRARLEVSRGVTGNKPSRNDK